ncbi:Phox homologous domain containing protein [Naviculisporaceae sp. PSN 640]
MASETLQEHPSQQFAIGNNGHRSGTGLSSPNGVNKQDRQTPRSMVSPNGNGRKSLSAVLGEQQDGGEAAANRQSLFGESDELRAGNTRSNSFLFGDDEDASSETVTSPSVTSPPYWMLVHGRPDEGRPGRPGTGGGTRHYRAVSNASVDSVIPNAITLRDNECEDDDDRPDSGGLYGRDRNRACWAKSVQIVDSVLVNGSATNIGAFVVWNIRVETLNGSYMNIRKRYSEFDDLRRRLVQTFPNFEAAVPVLPPKSVISKFRPKFLEKRRAGLQYFLNCILLNPEFSGSPVLKEFLFE